MAKFGVQKNMCNLSVAFLNWHFSPFFNMPTQILRKVRIFLNQVSRWHQCDNTELMQAKATKTSNIGCKNLHSTSLWIFHNYVDMQNLSRFKYQYSTLTVKVQIILYIPIRHRSFENKSDSCLQDQLQQFQVYCTIVPRWSNIECSKNILTFNMF